MKSLRIHFRLKLKAAGGCKKKTNKLFSEHLYSFFFASQLESRIIKKQKKKKEENWLQFDMYIIHIL